MRIKELLNRDITKIIPPVIFFHDTKPETLETEVSEYVITGGGHEKAGIHDEFVRLLNAVSESLQSNSETLPASWISGYFGSGKSSFAKLLGLGLGGGVLPSGKKLADALIERDDTANSSELRVAWDKCSKLLGQTIPVVFDISSTAESEELPARVIYRQIQKGLGYSDSEPIARFEHTLEVEGNFEKFKQFYQKQYDKPWDENKNRQKAPDQFSLIYHQLYPDEFKTPQEWYNTRYTHPAMRKDEEIQKVVKDIAQMISLRRPGHRVLVVIDEMSQFIGKNTDRMLNLQTFISAIGALPGTPIWLFVTGQEKLEDGVPGLEISKMQDRFPAKFRVHLHKTNVNEIVRRRILKKSPAGITALNATFTPEAVSRLKNIGYESDKVTREELMDYYPVLPSYVSLLLQISHGIKAYSTRAQTDSASVRNVLQTISDLFNRKDTDFKEKETGALVSMSDIYDVMHSALESEVITTIDRIREKFDQTQPLAVKLARIIAVMQVIREQVRVSEDVLCRLIVANTSEESRKEEVRKALEHLETENFAQQDESHGWGIKDTAAQEWGKDRDRIAVGEDEIRTLLDQASFDLIDSIPRPVLLGIPIETEIYHRGSLVKSRALPKVRLDLQLSIPGLFSHAADYWLPESKRKIKTRYGEEPRICLVSGETGLVEGIAVDILKSEKMLQKNSGQLSPVKQRLLQDEKRRHDTLRENLAKVIVDCWAKSTLYYDGNQNSLSGLKSKEQFMSELKNHVQQYLPGLFSHFSEARTNIPMKDVEKLFDKEFVSPPTTLLDGPDGLSFLKRQGGRFEPVFDQGITNRVLQFVKQKVSVRGDGLIEYFGAPPYGFPMNVIQAAVITLLRAQVIRVKHGQMQPQKEATSFLDEGIRDSLVGAITFKNIEVYATTDTGPDPRDRLACGNFFRDQLGMAAVANDNESIHEAIFARFPSLVNEVETLLSQLVTLGVTAPESLTELKRSLDACRSDKSVQGSVMRMINHLPEITAGFQSFDQIRASLTQDSMQALKALKDLDHFQIRQLADSGNAEVVDESINKIKNQLKSTQPWRDLADVNSSIETVGSAYKAIRQSLIRKNDESLDAALTRLKLRRDYHSLSDDEHDELKAILESAIKSRDTESVAPSLLVLKGTQAEIAAVEARANDLMDDMLARKSQNIEIRRVPHNLSNREITNDKELEQVLAELREQCAAELNKGYRVRLV